MGVSAVLFDFDHTLGIDHQLEFGVLKELAHSACTTKPSDDEVREALEEFRSGAVPLDDMLKESYARWGCPPDRLERIPREFREHALHEAPDHVTPMAGAVDVVRDLQERHMPIGILTNGWTQLQKLKAELIGFPGPVLVSEEIGAWKPDPKAFLIAASRLGVNPKTTLFVGDELAVDIAGARAAGMLAAWADLKHSAEIPRNPKPDYVLKTLSDLLEIL